jgi:hypothetical protein
MAFLRHKSHSSGLRKSFAFASPLNSYVMPLTYREILRMKANNHYLISLLLAGAFFWGVVLHIIRCKKLLLKLK